MTGQEQHEQRIEVFKRVMDGMTAGVRVDDLVAALELEGAWNGDFSKSALHRAKCEDVRKMARTRGDDGRPLAPSVTGADGLPEFKQEAIFSDANYVELALYHERRARHHARERDYYLNEGRQRFGARVKRSYLRQLRLWGEDAKAA
jgi:hypothetical protein